MLSFGGFAEQVRAGRIRNLIVGFTDMAGKLMGKRYDAEYVVKAGEGFETHACDYLLATTAEGETIEGFKAANWQRGFGDFHCVPDWRSLRVASWQKGAAIVLCDLVDPKTHALVPHGPRSVLRRQIDAAAAAGFGVDCASELEYYVYDHNFREAHNRGYRRLTPAGWHREDYHLLQGSRTEDFHDAVRLHLKQSGIEVENSKGEFGIGQHELNVVYSDALTMADNHVIYKFCLKEVADRMGRCVTFMAKPDGEDAGSGCHIHLNLVDKSSGRNAFRGAETFSGIANSSDAFRHFLGGWIRHTPDFMAFSAPTINSYKRYRLGSWAPTRLAWSDDNRTAGFRVVGAGNSLRIENRLPGADVNPYLAFAGSIAAGMCGLATKCEPGDAFRGNIYDAAELPLPPLTLRDAADAFSASPVARAALTDDVVDHYTHYFRKEVEAYNQAVTDWELKRYFEHI